MATVKVDDYRYPQGWTGEDRSRRYCQQQEEGKIVLFDSLPFDLPESDREFLLSQKQSGFKGHKNVSYRPQQDSIRGAAEDDPQEAKRLHELMRNYSKQVVQFLSRFLAPYAPHWTLDFATWRPLEEQGRDLPLHKRNDLLHVDAFPSRPTHGSRILRCFTNLNPQRSRVWATTEGFEMLAERFALDAGLSEVARRAAQSRRHSRRRPLSLRRVHAPIPRLPQGKQRLPAEMGEDPARVPPLFDVDGLHRFRAARGPLGPVRSGTDVHRPDEGDGRASEIPIKGAGIAMRAVAVPLTGGASVRCITRSAGCEPKCSLLHTAK
jgi:hypothetical protein